MHRITVAAALCVGLATYGALDAHDRVPGILTIDRDPTAPPEPAPSTSGAPRVPVPSPAPSSSPAAVPAPSAAGLRAALAPALADRRLGPQVSLTVRDGMTGAHLLDVAADTPRTPASTAKLLTAAAVLPALGPTTRFTTSTVLAPDGTVVLVAGGDMLLGRGDSQPGAVLGHAGVSTLATETAAALRRAGRTSVRVRLDRTYATGEDLAPTWSRSFYPSAIVGKVGTLGLADGLVEPGHPGPPDPAGQVADLLVEQLRAAGLDVTGDVVEGPLPPGSTPLAGVASATVSEQLAVALARSDNALTESLARQAYVRTHLVPAGRPVGYPEVAAWIGQQLASQGLDVRGLHLADACGLSPGTVVPARLVGDVLARGTTGADPALGRVWAGLPVAGLTGTLSGRYVSGPAAAGAGLVRAKTGTLTGVSALGGTVVDRDGRPLVFAVLADKVPASSGTVGARDALDALATRLAGCGCR